jgi:nitroimidazol reductase NimA-like FMN-containing flavoprotein (pyridoxamine 5'-phosphate oxidase superfamily)
MSISRQWLRVRVVVSTGVLMLAACIAPAADDKPAPQGANAGSAPPGTQAVIVPGRPLTPEARMSDKHMKPPPGVVCIECHDIKFDVDGTTSATRLYINNQSRLSQEQIWEGILGLLPGRERFVIATVAHNRPTATTVDMVLDKEEQVFYVVSEVGTEKLLQLRKNPAISAVHFDYSSWTVAEGGPKVWSSVQITGEAEVIPSSDPRFMPLLKKYNLVRLTPERAVRRFDLVRVTPQQIIYFNTALAPGGYSVYQLWKRGRTGVIND